MSVTARRENVSAISAATRKMIMDANATKPTKPTRDGPAQVIPFPAARMRGFIQNVMRSVQDYPDESAIRWIKTAIRKHRSRLKALGIEKHLIDADVEALAREFFGPIEEAERSRTIAMNQHGLDVDVPA